MIISALLLSAVCVVCRSSGIPATQLELPVGVQVGPPAVVASSSQYFERTFNRLVAAPPILQTPVIPVVPTPPVLTVQPLAKSPPPIVQVPATPTQEIIPQEQPNFAIAIATAYAAAPVSTILLPPFPFGFPPNIGVISSVEPRKRDPEPTTSTQKPTTTRHPTSRPAPATPQPNNPGNFGQRLPLNLNTNYNQYAAPPFEQIPLQMTPPKPIKLRTSVEIVPVPLQYIAPPPIRAQPIKHIHTFIPTKARIIIRPVHRPSRLIVYRRPVPSRITNQRLIQGPPPPTRSINREVEPTTFRPSNRPLTKPPKL